eukprot:TRINITY_DN94403_c0_g1_i1.p1 TRINITY_DN94403_c0_g1~~TRINITY_DN94403_c0_g1_i1.p1  ORF type:complete len:234 (-),score=43.33 TRINITY_DN94403_c0_g1_i1:358-1059(-)
MFRGLNLSFVVFTATLVMHGSAEIEQPLLRGLHGRELAASSKSLSCIANDEVCDPTSNSCCQGPGLMTCRMRESVQNSGKKVHRCGQEFPHQLLKDPTCTVEGHACDPGHQSATGGCCDVDASRPLVCLAAKEDSRISATASATSTKDKKAPRYICSVDDSKLKVRSKPEHCTAEGESCNPDLNSCCQKGTFGSSKGRQAPVTCQLGVVSPSVQAWPNGHGMAYICASEKQEP